MKTNGLSGGGNPYYTYCEPPYKPCLEPIPLTEEWLLKLGYEFLGVVESNQYESYKRYRIHNFIGDESIEVHIITSNYGGVKEVEYVTSIGVHARQYNGELKYVHQLQNAVFKETGKELTI